jgi:hypothetical protein
MVEKKWKRHLYRWVLILLMGVLDLCCVKSGFWFLSFLTVPIIVRILSIRIK